MVIINRKLKILKIKLREYFIENMKIYMSSKIFYIERLKTKMDSIEPNLFYQIKLQTKLFNKFILQFIMHILEGKKQCKKLQNECTDHF